MPEISIIIKNKIAYPASAKAFIVRDNTDYVINFDFDGEWDADAAKTARFAFGSGYVDVPFTGGSVTAPLMDTGRKVDIGVFAGDLSTTTPASLPLLPSIRSNGGAPVEPESSVYDKIMTLLNSKANNNQGVENAGKFWKVGENGSLEFGEGSSGSGLSSAEKSLIISILRDAVYNSDQSANIASLATQFGIAESVWYTITYNLTNATSNNTVTTAQENSSYSATITANEGYTLDSVTVIMGDADITSTAYADGAITIASITGNVTITATATQSSVQPELITDGLQAFFDKRNSAASSGNNKTGYYVEATQGTGRLYSWDISSAGSEYGDASDGEYCAGESYNVYNFGTEFTWVLLGYCADYATFIGSNKYITPSNFGTQCAGTYNKTDGTTSEISATTVGKKQGYQTVVIRVSGNALKIYANGALTVDVDGSTIDSFKSWWAKFKTGNAWSTGRNSPKITAILLYNRALTDVEITETLEYLNTLEVA